LERFDVFRRAILAASHAAIRMVAQLEAYGLEPRLWTASGWPTIQPLDYEANEKELRPASYYRVALEVGIVSMASA
jgi:hypothetical protein